jgi:hypothetical protein
VVLILYLINQAILQAKKNGCPEFAGQPLRRRTDEEIIRLIIRLLSHTAKILPTSARNYKT